MKTPGMWTDRVIRVLVYADSIDRNLKETEKVRSLAEKTASKGPKNVDKKVLNSIFGDKTMSKAHDLLDETESRLSRVLSEKMDWPEGDSEMKAFEAMVNVREKHGPDSKEMKAAVKDYTMQLAITTMGLNSIKINTALARSGIPKKRKALAGVEKFCQQVDKAAKTIMKFPRVGGIDPQLVALTLMQHTEVLSSSASKVDGKYAELDKKLQKVERECADLLADNLGKTKWIAKHPTWKEDELERQKKKL